ncbi:MAG: hypothetical protein ACREM6_02190 [Vulcanimicrobiaceae bacterium]
MRYIKLPAVAFALSLVATLAIPAFAAEMSKSSCATEVANVQHLEYGARAMGASYSGTDADKTFADSVKHEHEVMMAASKMELACGKNTHAQAMAKSTMARVQKEDVQMRSVFAGP